MVHELKLIQIYVRRQKILKEKLAKVGIQAEATVQMEIEDIDKSISELETTLKRRLQSLMEKAAIYGINADPSISIEIEDIQKYFEDKK